MQPQQLPLAHAGRERQHIQCVVAIAGSLGCLEECAHLLPVEHLHIVLGHAGRRHQVRHVACRLTGAVGVLERGVQHRVQVVDA